MTAPLYPLLLIALCAVAVIGVWRSVHAARLARSIDVRERCAEAVSKGCRYFGELVRFEGGTPAIGSDERAVVTGEPFFEDVSSVNFLNVLGDSRTGKTQFILNWIRQELLAGTLVFFLDNKSDVDVWAYCADECERVGADFRFFSPGFGETSHAWSVVRDVGRLSQSPERFAATLAEVLGAADGKEPYFAAVAQELLLYLVKTYPEADSLAEFTRILSDPDTYEFLSKALRDHTTHLKAQLARFGSIPVLNPDAALSETQRKHAISIPDLVLSDSPGVVYFKLFQSPELGRLALELLRRACALRAGTEGPRRVVAIIDEVQFMVGGGADASYLGRLWTTAASSGLSIITAHQGYSQFEDDRSLLNILCSLPTVHYGANDGVTNETLRKTWDVEWTNQTEDGNVTRQREPELRSEPLRFLCRSPYARGMFLACIPRGARHPGYTYGRGFFANTTEEYEEQKARGWPKDDDLPGSVYTPPHDFFPDSSGAVSPPSPARDEALDDAVANALAAALGNGKEKV